MKSTLLSLHIDENDLTLCGERRQQAFSEHRPGAETAMKQDQRAARPVNLVVQLDAVDVRVLARPGLPTPRVRLSVCPSGHCEYAGGQQDGAEIDHFRCLQVGVYPNVEPGCEKSTMWR